MRWLDTFSGVGMYALGLEQAGHEVIGFCENDTWAHQILKKHWPMKPISWSIQSLREALEGLLEVSPVKTYPLPGGGAGLAGRRSGLFWELVQTVRLVRPKYWLMENVAAILGRGMGDVLAAVATSGYDAEWDCISSGSVGAPHYRLRTYILAHHPSLGGQRLFPKQIQRQPEFSFWQNVRNVEELPGRSDLYPSQLCGGGNGVTKRLHAAGNGNPPCVIREITKDLKNG